MEDTAPTQTKTNKESVKQMIWIRKIIGSQGPLANKNRNNFARVWSKNLFQTVQDEPIFFPKRWKSKKIINFFELELSFYAKTRDLLRAGKENDEWRISEHSRTATIIYSVQKYL